MYFARLLLFVEVCPVPPTPVLWNVLYYVYIVYTCVCIHIYIYIYIYIYDAGPMVSPLVVVLFVSPSGLVWPRPLPPCGVGPVVFLVGPAPPAGAVCSTEVWYGCCRLLVVMSSLRALSPPTPVGWGLWSFWLAPPSLCVFYRDMVCDVLVTIQNMMLLFSPCKRCPCPCSDAVLRSCEAGGGGDTMGKGGGVGARDPRAYIYIYIYIF